MTHVLDAQGQRKVTSGLSRGMIFPFFGSVIPDHFLLCDGTNQTPDLRDRFIVGDTAIGLGSAFGSVSVNAALTHAGTAVGNHDAHVVTQPAAHDAHAVTQPAAHSNHAVTQAGTHSFHAFSGGFLHDTHTGASATAGTESVISDNFQHQGNNSHNHDEHSAHIGAAIDAHSAHSAAALDAHSAHVGAALDAHSAHGVTQPSAHAIPRNYLLAYMMWSGVE